VSIRLLAALGDDILSCEVGTCFWFAFNQAPDLVLNIFCFLVIISNLDLTLSNLVSLFRSTEPTGITAVAAAAATTTDTETTTTTSQIVSWPLEFTVSEGAHLAPEFKLPGLALCSL